MMDMMNSTGWGFGLAFLWGLHVLSVIAFFTGVVFLIVLAVKTFTQAQLKTWAIWLMVVGTVICLFTIGVLGAPWGGFGIGSSRMGMVRMGMMGGEMMERMMEHDEGSDGEEHEEHEDMEDMMKDMMGMNTGMGAGKNNGHDDSMTMDDMVAALEGKTGDAFDEAFIDAMIPHHQGAIDMAREALQNAKHDEIKQMARDIISAQQREIEQMREWQRAWGYNQ